MFTQQCFIRKNDISLKFKLSELGYNVDMRDFPKGFNLITDGNSIKILKIVPQSEEWIDCGTSEHMFLALAALRDDTDRYQWFVYNDNPRVWIFCKGDKFHFDKGIIIGRHKDGVPMWKEQDITDSFHKATLEEIVEYLK